MSDLRSLSFTALLIDGVHFGEHLVLAAVGVDEQGEKHVLGLREGATENAAACKALVNSRHHKRKPPGIWHLTK
jgi:transposase-like protein